MLGNQEIRLEKYFKLRVFSVMQQTSSETQRKYNQKMNLESDVKFTLSNSTEPLKFLDVHNCKGTISKTLDESETDLINKKHHFTSYFNLLCSFGIYSHLFF